MTRLIFDRELQQLQDRLLALGSEVAQNVVDAAGALQRRDDEDCRRLIRGDEQVNQSQIAIEHDSLTLIATQQPIARDLRFIAAVIAIAGELERINDYAKGIAKINLLIGEDPLLAPAVALPPMAAKASDMLRRSLDAFIAQDVERAYAIHEEDDEVDALYNQIYRALLDEIVANGDVMDQATHLLWAAHNLERTADRVSNICERVVFMVTGELVEMPEEDDVSYPR